MSRLAALLLVLLPLAFAPACGGSGGDDPGPVCAKPGTLRAIAIQGLPAPDTVGTFNGFTGTTKMDVAVGGWGAFIANTSDPLVSSGVWIVLPDGNSRLAYFENEVAPGGGGATIALFNWVRVNAAGQVLVHVTLTGAPATPDFALLSAQVVVGAVTAKSAVVVEAQDMSGQNVTGGLASIDPTRTFFVNDGRVFFAGATNSADEGFWSVNVDGSNLNVLVGTGSQVPPVPIQTVLALEACTVSQDGNRFAFVCNVGGQERLYGGVTSTSTYLPIASDGQGLVDAPRFGSIADVHANGPLLMYDSGAVVWKALGDQGAPDHVMLLGSDTVAYTVLARSGDTASQAGGGTFGSLDLIQHRAQTAGPLIDAQLIGVPNGVDSAIYGLATNPASLAMFEGRPAPLDLGQTTFFTDTDTFPGLNAAGYFDVARDGGFAFAAALQNGTTGLFWLLPNCGLFTIAASGQPAPNGGTFGAFFPSNAHTTHDGVVLFTAPVNAPATTGLFRQGP